MASPPIRQYGLEMRARFYVAIEKALDDRYAVSKELILAEERKQKTALVRFGGKCGEAWMPYGKLPRLLGAHRVTRADIHIYLATISISGQIYCH